MKALLIFLALASCSRHKEPVPPPRQAEARPEEVIEDSTECFRPATLGEFRAIAEEIGRAHV